MGPESFSEETSIYDSYAREESELNLTDLAQSLVTPSPALSFSVSMDQKVPLGPAAQEEPIQPPSPSPPPSAPELRHPQPQRLLQPEDDTSIVSSDTSTLVLSGEDVLSTTSSVDLPSPGAPARPPLKKEKDKRGLFGKWGSDKNGKRSGKDRDREKDSQRAEKESGFFGSLFSKKKQDEQGSPAPSYSGSGRDAVAALLGSSKSSKLQAPSPSPKPGPMGYARYPIHVERAIYRLSHIKLANPRRPLYEQVLISNLMFWYLGVINKTQNPTATQATEGQSATAPVQPSSEKESLERERHEVDELQGIGGERLEKEIQEQEKMKEIQASQPQQQKKDSRRGTLTKPAPGQSGGRRTAEMPVKGPQYEMQHRVMEQEYNAPGYAYGTPPTSAGGGGSRSHRQASPPAHAQPTAQPDLASYAYTAFSYNNADSQLISQNTPHSGAIEQSWSPPGSAASSITQIVSSPSQNGPNQTEIDVPQPQSHAQRRSRSPPSQNHNRYAPAAAGPGRPQAGKGPMRSMSATSVASQSSATKPRKAASAHAVPNGRPRESTATPQQPSRGEEEDVPLALWQQQRRR